MKPKYDRNLRGFIDVGHVAEAAGVTRDAVSGWVSRNMGPQSLKLNEKHRNTISMRAAEEYLAATRVPKVGAKPVGWVTIKGVAEDASIARTLMTDWLLEEGMRCATYRNVIYVHPDDAKYAVLHAKSRRPLPGFISLTDLCQELDRNKPFIHRARRRMSIRTHIFREPGMRERGYLTAKDADAIREYSRTAERRPRKGDADYGHAHEQPT